MNQNESTQNTKEISQIVLDLLAERWLQNMSQSDLSRLTGISQVTISRIETGAVQPNLGTLEKIAKALGRSIAIVCG